LALPVSDRVLDELERRVLAEVADRKDRLEYRLETGVLALAWQTVHLQEEFVGFLLDLDQVRYRNGSLDFRKVDALSVNVLGKAIHSFRTSRKRQSAAIAECGFRNAESIRRSQSIGNPSPEIRTT